MSLFNHRNSRFNEDIYEIIMIILPSFNRGISISMDHCYEGKNPSNYIMIIICKHPRLVGRILCHINPSGLFSAKSCLYIYIYIYIYIVLHMVKWFQVLLSNNYNSIRYYSFVCTQLNSFKNSKWLNSYILRIHTTLTSTTTSGQIERWNNGNEGLHHIPLSSRTRA